MADWQKPQNPAQQTMIVIALGFQLANIQLSGYETPPVYCRQAWIWT
jgi:hypothetical protein